MTKTYADPWTQQSLLPPEAIQFTLSVGVVNSADHMQWQLEITSATDGVLLGLESTPHAPMAALEAQFDVMCARLRAELLGRSWTL